MNDLKSSMSTLKETHISSSSRLEISENLRVYLIMWVADLQSKFNSQYCKVSTIKVIFIEKECVPESWNGDTGENLDETGDIEPLYSDKSSLPVEAAFHSQ